MSLFAPKRSRSSKAASMREASRLSTRLEGAFRSRSFLTKLLLTVVSLVALLVVVKGWQKPFPHRLGDRVSEGIIARKQFMKIDPIATEQLRQQRAKDVPFVFRAGPLPLQSLSARLRSYLKDISSARSYNDLSPETQEAFELTLSKARGADLKEQDRSLEEEFSAIKAIISATGYSISSRIDELVSEFESFLDPLELSGLLDQTELDRHGISGDASIVIIPETVKETPSLEELKKVVLSPRDVLLSEQLQNSGQLGKSWINYPSLQAIKTPITRWLLTQSPVSLQFDATLTQEYRDEAREQVEPQGTMYERGTELVLPGQVIDEEKLSLLQAEFTQYDQDIGLEARLFRAGTVLVMLTVLVVLFGYYLVHSELQFLANFSRFSIYIALFIITVFLARQLSFDPWRAEVIPLLVMTMIVAVAFNQFLASLTAFLLSMIVTLSTVQDMGHFVAMISVTVTAAISLQTVASRSTLIKVGFLCGVTFFIVTWGIHILQSQAIVDVLTDWELVKTSLRGAGWCLVAGYLVAGSLPFVESAFGVVTDISLLEMSDISHPLLQELVRRAPGTYNHSIAVATIGEAAADAIGANGLLVRVGAYFHDIGKMIKPEYFIENMTENDRSRHEKLNPAMSTLIIIGHVKDGVDLADQHHLPQAIIDFIEQHHGTTLVEYFFREAERRAEEEDKEDVQESAFRYPGPKPQSKEAGVMMLSDACESASRTLVEPTAKRIESLVDSLLMKRLLDGQFDDSTLTLTELHVVKATLVKSLIAIYHGRVKYPEQKSA